jgi:hypothetical protein
MARIRSIKPETFTDPELATVSLGARWLFVGLWTEADDKGRIIDSPKRLAGAIFPHEEKVTAAKVKGWLDELEQIGSVRRYEAAGQRLLWLPHFLDHQKISHASKSRLPPHPDDEDQEEDPPPSGESPETNGKGSRLDLGSGSGSSDLGSGSSSANGDRTTTDDVVSVIVDWKRQAQPDIRNPPAWQRTVTTETRMTYGAAIQACTLDHPDWLPNRVAAEVAPEREPLSHRISRVAHERAAS